MHGFIEQQAIDVALSSCDGNVAAAARKLGVSRSTIYRRLGEQTPPGGILPASITAGNAESCLHDH